VTSDRDLVPQELLDRLAELPQIRDEEVERARTRLEAREIPPSAREMAEHVVDRLLAERLT
jgi:hypothetical protein